MGLWLFAVASGPVWSSARPRRHELFPEAKRLTIEDMHRTERDIERMRQRIRVLGTNIDHRLYGLTAPLPLDDG
jgi:hypothetical protein